MMYGNVFRLMLLPLFAQTHYLWWRCHHRTSFEHVVSLFVLFPHLLVAPILRPLRISRPPSRFLHHHLPALLSPDNLWLMKLLMMLRRHERMLKKCGFVSPHPASLLLLFHLFL